MNLSLYDLISVLIAAAINAGTPILFAALGEIITERSGILNIGIEGMMLIGALSGFVVSHYSQNAWFGVIAAAIATGIFSLIHACAVIHFKSNQVVCGLALSLLGAGCASFFGKNFVGLTADSFNPLTIPVFSEIPIIGPGFFNHNILVYCSYLTVFCLWIFIFWTRPGLNLQFCGNNPSAALLAGINITVYQYCAVFFGGVMSGIGGAYLSLADTPSWMDQMTGGRGWIAVALVIFAGWKPVRAMWGAWLFGGMVAVQFRIQAFGLNVSLYLLKMLPYLFTIIVLMLIPHTKNTNQAPEAMGKPFFREEKK